MTKETKPKEEAREPKPKYRAVIPPNFQIRRSPSPMHDILREAERLPPEDSPSLNDSPSPQEYPLGDSPSQTPPIAHRRDSPPSGDSPSLPDSPSLDFWAAIPHVAGFTKLPHRVVDGLYGQLDLVEQALYTQLFRLSHGYGKDFCTIGLPTLAKRANVSRTAAAAGVKRLESKGLIVKERMIFGKNVEQGITYRLPFPDSPSRKDSPSPNDTIKEEGIKKKDHKGVAASPNFQNCPDCSGTGFTYKADRTVDRCAHPKLEGK